MQTRHIHENLARKSISFVQKPRMYRNLVCTDTSCVQSSMCGPQLHVWARAPSVAPSSKCGPQLHVSPRAHVENRCVGQAQTTAGCVRQGESRLRECSPRPPAPLVVGLSSPSRPCLLEPPCGQCVYKLCVQVVCTSCACVCMC